MNFEEIYGLLSNTTLIFISKCSRFYREFQKKGGMTLALNQKKWKGYVKNVKKGKRFR